LLGGVYVFHIFDNYGAAGWCLLFIALCECIAMAWMFGINRFWNHVCEMIGFIPAVPFFKWCWAVITPLSTSVLMLVSLAFYKPLKYGDYIYPGWGLAICWFLTFSSILWIPGYALYYYFFKTNGTFYERWQQCITPQNKSTLSKIQPVGENQNMMEMEPFCNETNQNIEDYHLQPPKYDDITGNSQ